SWTLCASLKGKIITSMLARPSVYSAAWPRTSIRISLKLPAHWRKAAFTGRNRIYYGNAKHPPAYRSAPCRQVFAWRCYYSHARKRGGAKSTYRGDRGVSPVRPSQPHL